MYISINYYVTFVCCYVLFHKQVVKIDLFAFKY